MIVSASRRTDIPAYYAPWLFGRIDSGYCLVRNPYDARRLSRVSLAPEDVDFLVLWTRDPRPMLARMRDLDGRGIRSYFQMTIAGYPEHIEPGAPSLDEATAALRALSDIVGPRRVLWRYDPVFVAQGISADWHRRNFERIASALEGGTERVAFSLLDEYALTASRLGRAGESAVVFGSALSSQAAADAPRLPPPPYAELLPELASIARSRGMTPLACAEPFDLSSLGIEAGSCVDPALAASIWPELGEGKAEAKRKDSGQRKACRCAPSVDIGAYGSCPRGCAYCYANRGPGKLLARGLGDECL